jgi:hypothetical protein
MGEAPVQRQDDGDDSERQQLAETMSEILDAIEQIGTRSVPHTGKSGDFLMCRALATNSDKNLAAVIHVEPDESGSVAQIHDSPVMFALTALCKVDPGGLCGIRSDGKRWFVVVSECHLPSISPEVACE